LLLRDSGFDHFGDAAGGKQEDEDYGQVFHGSMFSAGRGKSMFPRARHAQVRSDFSWLNFKKPSWRFPTFVARNIAAPRRFFSWRLFCVRHRISNPAPTPQVSA
jgi:hypothetical protein